MAAQIERRAILHVDKLTKRFGTLEAVKAVSFVEGVAQQDGGLVVTALQARSWEIARALGDRKIYVSELVPLHHTLEEFFMEITGTDPTTGRERT